LLAERLFDETAPVKILHVPQSHPDPISIFIVFLTDVNPWQLIPFLQELGDEALSSSDLERIHVSEEDDEDGDG
jgi:hypothetical protein